MLNQSNAQVVDAVYTGIIHGNKNSEGVANFLAPIVPVDDLTGVTLVMNDDAFVAPDNTFRAPGSNFEFYTPTFGSRTYNLKQESVAWSIPFELDRIAKTRAAKLDLRKQAIYTVMKRLENRWERYIADTLGSPKIYEASNSVNLALTPSDQWTSPISNIEDQIIQANIIINRQSGVRANKLLLTEQSYRALVTNPRIRDFLARGTQVNEQTLATLFRLDEVKIASQTVIASASGKKDYVWNNSALLFYSPTKKTTNGLVPCDDANKAEPSSFYQYQLKGSAIGSKEMENEYNNTYWGKIIVERSLELIGLGSNGLISTAFLFENVADLTPVA